MAKENNVLAQLQAKAQKRLGNKIGEYKNQSGTSVLGAVKSVMKNIGEEAKGMTIQTAEIRDRILVDKQVQAAFATSNLKTADDIVRRLYRYISDIAEKSGWEKQGKNRGSGYLIK